MVKRNVKHLSFGPRVAALGFSAVTIGLPLIAPAAAPATSSVDVKINGSNGPVTVPKGTVAYVSWTSQAVSSCSYVAKIGSTVVASGSKPTSFSNMPTPAIEFSMTYTFTCKKTGSTKTVSDSATVSGVADSKAFANPQPVSIVGYDGSAMEPFLSKDEEYLFFNNSNDSSIDTNLYYAVRVDDTTFTYRGEVGGVNNLVEGEPTLEAGPTMDEADQFYFTTDHAHAQQGVTTFVGTHANGTVSDPAPVFGLAPTLSGWVTMDVGVSRDGTTMYYANAELPSASDPVGTPVKQSILNVAAKIDPTNFGKLSNSATLLAKINNAGLNYAPEISANGLELFFTRSGAEGNEFPRLYVARRTSATAAFSTVQRIVAADGFVEGPTLSADGKRLYYHKMHDPENEPGVFKIYMVTRP